MNDTSKRSGRRGMDLLPKAQELSTRCVDVRVEDLTGKRFGRVVVLGLVEAPATYASRGAVWSVRCDCGRIRVTRASRLKRGIMPKCPRCPLVAKVVKPTTRRDLTGRVFGRLCVIRAATRGDGAPADWGHWVVACACEAGRVTVKPGTSLVEGNTASCGCLRREAVARINFTHGLSKTPEYDAWINMIGRCHRPDHRYYAGYGARGIRVCDGWRTSFEVFRADVGPRPTSGHSIDRIDNDGGYTCGACDDCRARGAVANCRWTTADVQLRNTTRNIYVVIDGARLCLGDAADRLGIPRSTAYLRVLRGMAPEEALRRTPRQGRHRER